MATTCESLIMILKKAESVTSIQRSHKCRRDANINQVLEILESKIATHVDKDLNDTLKIHVKAIRGELIMVLI